MLSSVAMMIAGRTYTKFEHTLSIQKLLKGVVITVVLLTLLIRFSFFYESIPYLPLIIIVGFRVIYLICNLEFWGLSSMVFDVRQGKRLFGLISSGDVPAKLLGYLSVSVLVPLIGLSNLVWIAAAAFATSYYFLRKILVQPDLNLQVGHDHEHQFSDRKILTGFFGNNFIFLLAVMGFITTMCFTFIDFAFLYNVQQQYHTQESLASFLGIFFAIGYSFTILIKMLFSGRFAEKTGIRTSLLVMPIFFLLFSIGFVILGLNDKMIFSNLAYIGVMSMAIGVVKYSINDPVYLAMFQPLPPNLRLKGHTIIKGFVQPLALGITGIILYLLFYFMDTVSFNYLNEGFIALALIWIYSVFRSHKRYISTLAEAIRKRFISGSAIALEQSAYTDLLKQSLLSEQKEEIIFGITSLETKFPELLREEMAVLLKNDHSSIRKICLQVIKRNDWNEFAYSILPLCNDEKDESLRADASFICARAGMEEITSLINSSSFDVLPDDIKNAILSGVLNSPHGPNQVNAVGKIKSLFNSYEATDLEGALYVTAEAYHKSFREDIVQHFRHTNDKVQQAAIFAAGKSKDNYFIQPLLDLMHEQNIPSGLAISLGEFGDEAIELLLNKSVHKLAAKPRMVMEITRMVEKTKSEKGCSFLFSLLPYIRIHNRERLIDVLSNSKFTISPVERKKLMTLMQEELFFAASLLDGITDKSIPEILRSTLEFEFENCKRRIISFAGLLYNRIIVRSAAAALRTNAKVRIANALEVIEQVTPRKTARILVALLENIPPEEKLIKLRGFSVHRKHENPDSIIREGTEVYSDWSVSVALRSAAYSDSNFIYAVNLMQKEGPLLQHAAAIYLLAFKENNPVHFSTLCGTFKIQIESIMKHRHDNTISEFEKVMVLRGTALFGGTPENIIAEIIPIVREEFIPAGETIFKKGDSGSSMYVIYTGEVKIHDGDKTFAMLGKRDFFGELALLDPEPRSASATAVTDTMLLKLQEEEAYELMEERVEVLRSILRILCKRIRSQNEKIVASGK